MMKDRRWEMGLMGQMGEGGETFNFQCFTSNVQRGGMVSTEWGQTNGREGMFMVESIFRPRRDWVN